MAILFAIGVSACSDDDRNRNVVIAEGSPEAGKHAIANYGCGSCHTIPGVEGADATVGPPLINFSQGRMIAGQLANTPENLARWIRDPQGVEPGTAMPDLGVTAQDAENMAAYLLSID